MILYRTTDKDLEPKECEVKRFNAVWVWIGESTIPRVSPWQSYHETPEQAREYRVGLLTERKEELDRELEELQSKLDSLWKL